LTKAITHLGLEWLKPNELVALYFFFSLIIYLQLLYIIKEKKKYHHHGLHTFAHVGERKLLLD
jgi:hypothetical protein